MSAYQGAGIFPYAMTVANTGGVSNPAVISENIPIINTVPATNYQFTIIASFASTWAAGIALQLTFYGANGNTLLVCGGTPQTNMTGGTLYQIGLAGSNVTNGFATAPAGSSYAIAQIIIQGNPGAANLLSVYQAEIDDSNFNQVNINYAFSWTFWPWSSVSGATLAWTYNPLITGDSDSLVLAGQIELMGGQQGVQCLVPELLDSNGQGPTIRLLAPPALNSTALGYQPSYDLNAPQPNQDVVASMLLDGERPFGARASNRTMSLPIVIFGTMAGGMNQVLRAEEYLMALIDAQLWEIKWTPADTGLGMLFDCFRALPSTPVYGFNYSSGGTATGSTIGRPNYPIAVIHLQIQAMPYGRSDVDGIQNLALANPLVNGVPTSSPVTVDNFATVFNPPPIINSPTWTSLGFNNPTGVTTWNISTTSSTPAGNTLVVQVLSSSNNVTGVTDSVGNIYKLAASQSTSGSCWQFIFTAPVNTTLPNAGTITVSASGSGNFCSTAYKLTGAWTPSQLVGTNGTAATYSSTQNVNQYTMVVAASFGLGSAGGTPTNFTSVGTNSGNGFNDNLAWYAQPINQTQASVAISGLPNPYGLLLFAFAPVNQYWVQDPVKGLSGNAVHYQPPRPLHVPWPAATYTQTLATPVNIVGAPVLSVLFGQSYDVQWPKDPKFISNVTLAWTLTDSSGNTLKFSVTKKKVTYGTHPSVPKWTQINALIPQGKRFNYNSVSTYTVRITNWNGSGNSGYVRMHAWLNNLVANPQTVQNAVSPRGSLYNLFSLAGSARSPISVQCQLPAGQNITKEITTPATGYFIVPPNVYNLQGEGWGGGGAGAALNLGRSISGGGGGGAEYAQEPSMSVYPGQKIPWSIGAAGLPGQLTNTVVQYTNTGLSHWTCPPNVFSVLAEIWGGGAAGPAGGGGGGGAEYARAHVPVTPGVTYSLWTAKGGKADTGTSAAQVAARQGQISWFGPPGALVGTQGYLQAKGGQTGITGGTSGGYGGTGGTVAPQTQMNLAAGFNSPAGVTIAFGLTAGKSVPAGDTGLLVISVPAAATIKVTDSAKNTWTQIASATSAGNVTYVFMCTPAKALNQQSLVTITQTVNQVATVGLFDLPWVVGQDVAATTNSGTSTSPTITSGAAANSGDLVVAIFSNPNANTSAGPGGSWSSFTALSGGPYTNVYCIQNPSTGTETAIGTYASSQTWNSIAITLATEVHWAGGRGGASPGPSGGGGGGAGGSTGAGGPGGDSQPSVANVGRWQQGGAGGTGNGVGGNGGAGANTPGFPAAGAAPGGGGGGGYQTQPVFNPANPSNTLPGQQQTNFLGADGGNGMVQLTYAVGSGQPVNGGNTTFGSTATTGTILTAHGGQSASNNSAAGANGGTGSSNTIAHAGGNGGLNTSGALGSYMASPVVSTLFQSLATTTFNSTSGTTGTAASSCAQGVAMALIESTAKVSDLVVTDSAGNVYQNQGVASAGAGGNGVTVYAYVANIEFPITTSTTLTATSVTSQQYGVLWYASPWLVAGVTSGNSGSGNGTSAAFTAQFGTADVQSIELEMGVVLCDGSQTFSSLTQTKTWFNASSTFQLAAGTMQMSAFVMENMGGGTGAASTGDVFSGSLSGSANWATLAIPLAMINQQAALVKMDWRSGTTPGAQTTWATEAAISAQGMIVVVGQAGSGASITSGPSAIADASGNTYTFQNRTTLPANGGTVFIATAPVTHALAAGTTGTYNWGTASAAPNYWTATYWVPNAVTAIDVSGVSAVTANASAVSGTYTPGNPNDQVLALVATNAVPNPTLGATVSPWNWMDTNAQNTLKGVTWAAQATDEAALTFSQTLSASVPVALLLMGIQMQLAGTGGGAAGGPNNAGYPGVWAFGGPAYSGGGKGGQGAAPPPQAGNGASYPGGGGGGALGSASGPQEGGQGAPGAIRLTWTPPLQPFNTLIVHSLGANTDPNVNPIVTIPITDVPNNTEYAVPSVNGLLPATFSSSYTVLLANYYWNNSTSSNPRQITVTVNQYEYPGGPKYSVQVSRAITPATDSVNGMLNMGEVTLPVKDFVAYNDQSYFTVSINDTDTSDRFMDVLFLDTTGQTVLINIDPGQPGFGQYVNYFIDEATADRDLGFVGASFQDRQHQVSVLDYAQISGGALYIASGDNLFLVYSPSGAPNLSVQYSPRWYLSRSV